MSVLLEAKLICIEALTLSAWPEKNAVYIHACHGNATMLAF